MFCTRFEKHLDGLDVTNYESLVPSMLSYVGYTTHIKARLHAHDNFASQAYVMTILKGALEMLSPGNFQLDKSVIMLPFESDQSYQAELFISRLIASYVSGGTGFSSYQANQGNTKAHESRKVKKKDWDEYFDEAYPTISAQWSTSQLQLK